MLFIKVVPENYGKILKRCKDMNRKFLEEHQESDRILGETHYAAPWWTSKFGETYSWSVLFREDYLNEEMDFPHGKSDTEWFQATRKKS